MTRTSLSVRFHGVLQPAVQARKPPRRIVEVSGVTGEQQSGPLRKVAATR